MGGILRRPFQHRLTYQKTFLVNNPESVMSKLSSHMNFSKDVSSLSIQNKTKLDFYKLMLDLMKKEVDKTYRCKKVKQKSKQAAIIKRYRVSLPFPLRNEKKRSNNKADFSTQVRIFEI